MAGNDKQFWNAKQSTAEGAKRKVKNQNAKVKIQK